MEGTDPKEMTIPLISSSHVSQNEAERVTVYSKIRALRDVPFLVAFVITIFVVLSIALTYGVTSVVNPAAHYWIVNNQGTEQADKRYDDVTSKLMLGVSFILCLSTVLSLAWIYLLSFVALYMVNAVIISLVVVSVLGSIVVLSMGYPSFGFLLILMALATLVISLLFQSRLEFASVNLDIACKAIIAIPTTIGYSLMMLLLQAAYVFIWCIAAIGFATNNFKVNKIYNGVEYSMSECASYKYGNSFEVDGVTLTCTSGSSCYACMCDGNLVSQNPCFTPRFYWSSMIGLLFALVWTNSVLVNIVHCTVVAAVAKWWETGHCSVETLQRCFHTLTTSSFGSICFGSLLGAIVRTARSVMLLVQRIFASDRRNDTSTLGRINRYSTSIVNWLLSFLERVIVYFNRYAFCFVAIEELDYIQASYAAVDLFQSRGLTALFNDDILDFIMYISNVFIAVVTMIAAYIFAKVVVLSNTYVYLLSIFGFFCGFVMGAVVLSTISSAIIAVYVCFARDPEAFETAHPALYPILANAWNKIFPGSLRYSESIQVHRNARRSGDNNRSPAQSSAVSQKIETKKVTFNVQPDRTVRGSYASPPDSLRGSAMSASSQQWSGLAGHEDEDIEAAATREGNDGNESSVLGTLWSSSNSFIQLMTQRMGYDSVSTTESSHGSNVEMKDNVEPASQHQRCLAGGQVVWGPNGSLSGIMRDLSVDPFAQTSRMSSSQSSNNSYSSSSGRGRRQQVSGGGNYNDDEDDDEVNAVV